MKILQINALYGFSSTGMIVKSISKIIEENGDESYVAYQYCDEIPANGYRVGNVIDWKIHAILTRVFGKQAYFSKAATKKLLKWIDTVKPDIIHLHNLHANYINLNMLCDYCSSKNIPVVLTLHDCWFFTGKCWHFAYENCMNWKNECGNCPKLKKEVPSWFFDKTCEVLEDKAKHLNSIKNLTVVGCSEWIVNLAKQSRLKAEKYVVIQNGVDLKAFKPVSTDFREKYNISEDKTILLGVSSMWTEKKGINTFSNLAEKLPEEKYTVVLVGELKNDTVISDRIIHINRTQNKEELSQIYSAADYFINPTLEEALGLVNIEALACGTPVITFNTGGSPECVDESCGRIIEDNSDESLLSYLLQHAGKTCFSSENCKKRSELFDGKTQYMKYYNLYNEILSI